MTIQSTLNEMKNLIKFVYKQSYLILKKRYTLQKFNRKVHTNNYNLIGKTKILRSLVTGDH